MKVKISKRILAICLILFVIVLSLSSGSIGVEYLTHDCSHDDDCHICIMYTFVSNFISAIVVILTMSLFVICSKRCNLKYRYESFRLLPMELKVRMNN